MPGEQSSDNGPTKENKPAQAILHASYEDLTKPPTPPECQMKEAAWSVAIAGVVLALGAAFAERYLNLGTPETVVLVIAGSVVLLATLGFQLLKCRLILSHMLGRIELLVELEKERERQITKRQEQAQKTGNGGEDQGHGSVKVEIRQK